jgi:hypothetical protein
MKFDENKLKQTKTLIRRKKAFEAMKKLQKDSEDKSLNKLTFKDIEEEIQSVRKKKMIG